MRNVSAEYKAYSLAASVLSGVQNVVGSAVQISPGDEQDGMTIVQIGTIAGSPSATTVTVTIACSATQNGTFTTIKSLTLVPTTSGQISTSNVQVNQGLYSWIKASIGVVFTAGTTPSVFVGVVQVQRQTIASDSNNGTVS